MKDWYNENPNLQYIERNLEMLLEKKHITDAMISFKSEKSCNLSADAVIDNTIRLVLFLAFRYPITNKDMLLTILKNIEPFKEAAKIECFEINDPDFYPKEDDINNKFARSGVVSLANYLWYGLLRYNLCSNEFIQIEKNTTDQLSQLSEVIKNQATNLEQLQNTLAEIIEIIKS